MSTLTPRSTILTFCWFAANRSSGRPVPPPRIGAAILFVRDPHWHHAQSVGERSFRANRPPVVEEDFHGSPHRDPSANQQTFFHNLGDVIAEKARDDISHGDRDAECADANDKASPPTAKELAQPLSRKLRTVFEKFVNGFPKFVRFIR